MKASIGMLRISGQREIFPARSNFLVCTYSGFSDNNELLGKKIIYRFNNLNTSSPHGEDITSSLLDGRYVSFSRNKAIIPCDEDWDYGYGMGAQDKTNGRIYTAYYIKDGYLFGAYKDSSSDHRRYCFDLLEVYGRGWTCISKDTGSSFYPSSSCLGIKEGSLYNQAYNMKISDGPGWTDIFGATSISSMKKYAYAVKDGQLYSVERFTVTKVNSETGWTCAWNSSISENPAVEEISFGIRSGLLYMLRQNAVTKIGDENNWQKVPRTMRLSAVGGGSHAYAIRDGKLYWFYLDASGNFTYECASADTGWTQCHPYGICNGKPYKLNGDNPGASQIITNDNFLHFRMDSYSDPETPYEVFGIGYISA